MKKQAIWRFPATDSVMIDHDLSDLSMAVASASKLQIGAHVAESGLLPEESACPFCSVPSERDRELLLQADPSVYLLSCQRCGGKTASRMPTEETLSGYYRRYYEHSESSITFENPVGFARHVLGTAAPFLTERSISILDFGGGGGDLSREIAKILLEGRIGAVEIELVDYNSDLTRDFPYGVAIKASQTMGEVKRTQFHLVLASAILEHIPSPRPTLIDLLSRIKPGGVFYARTPTVAPILRIFATLGLSYDFTFPGHVHDLGQSFWENVPRLVAAEVGPLEIVSSRPSIVETSFSKNPLRTLAAYVLKAPWYVLGSRYKLVGGWEVVFHKPQG